MTRAPPIALFVALLALAPGAWADSTSPDHAVFVELKALSQGTVAFVSGSPPALADEGFGFGIGYRYRLLEGGVDLEVARSFGAAERRADDLRIHLFAGVFLPIGRFISLDLRLRLGEYAWADVTDVNGIYQRGSSGPFIGLEPRIAARIYRDEYIWLRGFLGITIDLDLGPDFTGISPATPGELNTGLLCGFEASFL